jgi:hypothetical protein
MTASGSGMQHPILSDRRPTKRPCLTRRDSGFVQSPHATFVGKPDGSAEVIEIGTQNPHTRSNVAAPTEPSENEVFRGVQERARGLTAARFQVAQPTLPYKANSRRERTPLPPITKRRHVFEVAEHVYGFFAVGRAKKQRFRSFNRSSQEEPKEKRNFEG